VLYSIQNVSKQLHRDKQENNRINDADFVKYEMNSDSAVKQLYRRQ